MANNSKKEKVSRRTAYRRGYVQGFEDAQKNENGRGYSGAFGYRKGWAAQRKIVKINKKVDKYKKEF